jgi:hypothetical protein
MRRYLLLVALFSFFNYCTSDKRGEPKTITVDPKNIVPSEIVHDTLSATQIEKIKQIQLTFAEVFPATLEETITDFKRDAHPDNEIAIWSSMAEAYRKYFKIRPQTTNLDFQVNDVIGGGDKKC